MWILIKFYLQKEAAVFILLTLALKLMLYILALPAQSHGFFFFLQILLNDIPTASRYSLSVLLSMLKFLIPNLSSWKLFFISLILSYYLLVRSLAFGILACLDIFARLGSESRLGWATWQHMPSFLKDSIRKISER